MRNAVLAMLWLFVFAPGLATGAVICGETSEAVFLDAETATSADTYIQGCNHRSTRIRLSLAGGTTASWAVETCRRVAGAPMCEPLEPALAGTLTTADPVDWVYLEAPLYLVRVRITSNDGAVTVWASLHP